MINVFSARAAVFRPRHRNVFAEHPRWYIDPASAACKQASLWRTARPADAAQIDKIAAQPQADWFGEWSGNIYTAVTSRLTEIRAVGALPLFVAYNIPLRDRGNYSQGGADSARAYRQWIDALAAGVGNRKAVIILEPDALALMDCLSPHEQSVRYELLAYALHVLESRPQIAVYIDAGHSAWVPAHEMADRLKRAGMTQATGFALNVSNFRPTTELIAYGKAVAVAINSECPPHFVIDTSRNGSGNNGDAWCNPSGCALGERPTTYTADRLVDAYLWIKRPGESDGLCNGGPPAGVWWPEYALELARAAAY